MLLLPLCCMAAGTNRGLPPVSFPLRPRHGRFSKRSNIPPPMRRPSPCTPTAVPGVRDPPRRGPRRRSRRTLSPPCRADYKNAAPVPTTPTRRTTRPSPVMKRALTSKFRVESPSQSRFSRFRGLRRGPTPPIEAVVPGPAARPRAPPVTPRWWRPSTRKRTPDAAGTPRHSLRNAAVAPVSSAGKTTD